jgi:hypothetical protein
MTSGELIHRFVRRDDFGPGEYEAQLRRIVETVEQEAKADARATVIAEIRAQAKARYDGRDETSAWVFDTWSDVADWLEGKSDG